MLKVGTLLLCLYEMESLKQLCMVNQLDCLLVTRCRLDQRTRFHGSIERTTAACVFVSIAIIYQQTSV